MKAPEFGHINLLPTSPNDASEIYFVCEFIFRNVHEVKGKTVFKYANAKV